MGQSRCWSYPSHSSQKLSINKIDTFRASTCIQSYISSRNSYLLFYKVGRGKFPSGNRGSLSWQSRPSLLSHSSFAQSSTFLFPSTTNNTSPFVLFVSLCPQQLCVPPCGLKQTAMLRVFRRAVGTSSARRVYSRGLIVQSRRTHSLMPNCRGD